MDDDFCEKNLTVIITWVYDCPQEDKIPIVRRALRLPVANGAPRQKRDTPLGIL